MMGWYGKLPSTGDFITRRLPASFREPWDHWLQEVMQGSRETLGGCWRDCYLSMPAWRFAISPGLLTAQAWAGVMLPSVDSVGRCFPLTVAATLSPGSVDLRATLLGAASWFDAIEAAAVSALDQGADPARIDAAIAQHPFSADASASTRASGTHMLYVPIGTVRDAEPCAAWLAERSEVLERCLLLCERLPGAEQFCAMMDGRWVEHGWRRGGAPGGAGA